MIIIFRLSGTFKVTLSTSLGFFNDIFGREKHPIDMLKQIVYPKNVLTLKNLFLSLPPPPRFVQKRC